MVCDLVTGVFTGRFGLFYYFGKVLPLGISKQVLKVSCEPEFGSGVRIFMHALFETAVEPNYYFLFHFSLLKTLSTKFFLIFVFTFPYQPRMVCTLSHIRSDYSFTNILLELLTNTLEREVIIPE